MMTYKEYVAKYETVIKRFPGISSLFGQNWKITQTRTKYVKSGSRWKGTETETDTIDLQQYCNIFDGIQFFRNLGGYERTEMSYTKAGYIPVKQTSISPDRTEKYVWTFQFEH